jgi:hypothetical protein
MSWDTLSASLVFNGAMQQPPPRSESREAGEPGVAISVRPEYTSEESLVSGSNEPTDEAAALAGSPPQWDALLHGPPGDPGGAAAPPSVVLHVQYYSQTLYKVSDVASVLPRRVMGSSPDTWGEEGDECSICLGVMAAGEHVSDLPPCYHTFHLQCAADWLKTKVEAGQPGCCPVCNAEILKPVLLRVPRAGSRRSHEPPASPSCVFCRDSCGYHCDCCFCYSLRV